MESMLNHPTCQQFGTDCKDLIAMLREPNAWPNFLTKLEEIQELNKSFQDLRICYTPRGQNGTADFLARIARSFHKTIYFVACSIPV